LSSKSKELYDIIKEENSISIHIRRGDYLSSSNINYVGNICNITYYIEAIKKIEQMVENPVFFIFSNDIKWAQENLQLANVHYIDWNKKEDSWQDMFLMSKCKHNIIANSTFSWWRAWLNQYVEKIIISPDLFYNGEKATDLIPESWIKIKTKQEGNLYN
ncbi:MAG: alpha-1,2-fucosyltransferase, partial [Dysgonamonadaceae bacterium]|nr:alpha-1,2-fucosyltransferase [Dysgonamonadaceae bacterium]